MKPLPAPTVALVDGSQLPTRALLGVLPTLKANVPVLDANGLPTDDFRVFLKGLGGILPNATVPLALKDGTPTRSMTMLLANLP